MHLAWPTESKKSRHVISKPQASNVVLLQSQRVYTYIYICSHWDISTSEPTSFNAWEWSQDSVTVVSMFFSIIPIYP